MGLIDKFFGGGEEAAAKQMQQGYSKSQKYYQPYYDQGQRAYQNLTKGYDEMSNPYEFYNNISSQYRPSDAYQSKSRHLLNLLQNQQAQTGRLGLPEGQNEMGTHLNDLYNDDFQEFLRTIMGIKDKYLQGQGGLAETGYNAGSSLSQLLLGQYGAKAEGERAKAGGMSNLLTDILQGAGNYYTGGMSGIMKMFTGGGNQMSGYGQPPVRTPEMGPQLGKMSWSRYS